MSPSQPSRRGRPSKFGRPSRLVAMTLPDDVLEWLRNVHPDPAWAVVRLFDGEHPRKADCRGLEIDSPAIVQVSPDHALILVNPKLVRRIPGVATIPIGPDKAFLALEAGGGLADLELAVVDRLEAADSDAREHQALLRLRKNLKQWRTDPALRFESRTIIVVGKEHSPARKAARRPRLAGLSLSGLAWTLGEAVCDLLPLI